MFLKKYYFNLIKSFSFTTLHYAKMFAYMPLLGIDNHRRPAVNGINICGAACMAVPTGG